MLDVSAAFLGGDLTIDITGNDSATLSNSNGQLEITDADNNQVAITSPTGPVGVSDVDAIQVRGDATNGQSVVFNTPLDPERGVVVESSIESATVAAPITRVTSGGIRLQAQSTDLGADLEATSLDIDFGGDVEVTDDVTLTAARVDFAATLDDDGNAATGSAVQFETTEFTRLGGQVGGSAPLDGLRTESIGRTELNADVTTSGSGLIFNNSVLLTSDAIVADTSSTGIRFNDTIDSVDGGNHALTATATNGRVSFSGNIGDGAAGDQRLDSLTVTESPGGVIVGEKAGVTEVRTTGAIDFGSVVGGIGPAGILINAGPGGTTTFTSGTNVSFNGVTILASDVSVVATGNVTWTADAPINSQVNRTQRLSVNAGGIVAFNDDIGAVVPLNGLDLQRADGGAHFGGADTETAGGTGPVSRVNTTGPIAIGSLATVSRVTFNAGGGNTLRMQTTGDDVDINGPVELQSALTISTGSTAGDITFSSATSIDSAAGENNDLDLDAGAAAVLLNEDVGRSQSLGKITVAAGNGLTLGQSDTEAGATGPVELVRAVDGVDFGVGDREIGGAGITLNGGASGVSVESDGADLRFNGAVTLASSARLVTGPDAGDAVFTNDAPIDSQAGENNSVEFDLGDGALRLNENIGETQALDSFTVISARGGVAFGEAASEVPGTGATGPVEVVNTTGTIDVGVGTNVIDGGIQVNGGPILGTTFDTMGADFRMNGPITLGASTTILTNGGNATFTNDSPIDNDAGPPSDLMFDLVDGVLEINEDLGATNAIGALIVTRADQILLGAATNETPGSGGAGPVNLVRTRREIDLGVGPNVVAGGIVLNGGNTPLAIETANRDVRVNGPVSAQSDLHIDTGDGTGTILFTSGAPLDSHDGAGTTTSAARRDVLFDAGNGLVSINANWGTGQRVGAVTVERAGDIVIGGADIAVSGGLGPVTQFLAEGPINIGSVETIDGTTVLNGGSDTITLGTNGADVRFDSAVEVASNVELTTGTGGGDVSLTSASPLDSQLGEANDVRISVGSGNVTLGAVVGERTALGELRFASATDVSAEANVNAARVAQDAGSGRTTFEGEVNTTDVAREGIQLAGTDFVFNDAVTTLGDGRVDITHSGLLDINDPANMRLNGSFSESGAGTVELAADIRTTGDTIAFNSTVTLTDGANADVLLDTTAGGSTSGNNIRFAAAIDGETDSAERVTVNGGTTGDVTFGSSIGGATRVETVHVVEANDVTATGSVAVGNFVQDSGFGTTTLSTIDAHSTTEKAIDIETLNATFTNTVTTLGNGTVEVTVSGLLRIQSTADMTLNGSFLQDGGGRTETGGDITTTDDDVAFTDVVTLTDHIRIDTGAAAGDVRFESTLDGAVACGQNATFSSGVGDLLFGDAVGGLTALGDVTVQTATNTTFDSSLHANSFTQDTGTGETRFGGDVTIKSSDGVNIVSDTVRLDGALDTTEAAGPVTFDVTNDLAIDGEVRTGGAAVQLLADGDVNFGSNGAVTTDGGTITITADADNDATDEGAGGGIAMQDGATVDAGSGRVDVTADQRISLGQLRSGTIVTVTSHSGSITDGGDLGTFDIIAPEVAFRAETGVGTNNPIDLSVDRFAATNELTGGVRVDNRSGGPLSLTTVDGITGLVNGPQATGDGENIGGDVEITNSAAVTIDGEIRNFAGGNTTVRSGLDSDLTLNQPVQNRGGDGSIVLTAGQDLVVNDSVPDFIGDGDLHPDAEIAVDNEGTIDGRAIRDVLINNDPTGYAIIRTHAERVRHPIDPPELADEFLDPADYDPESPEFVDFLDRLERNLRAIRESTAPQFTNFDPPLEIEIIDQGGSNLDERGRAIVRVEIGDAFHLETNWHLQIDWGDGIIENYPVPGDPVASLGFITASGSRVNRQPDATITGLFESGTVQTDAAGNPIRDENGNLVRAPGVYFLHHTYRSNPNPDDPAAPIPIKVRLRFDPRPDGNGVQFVRNGTEEILTESEGGASNPGEQISVFVIVVESVIVPVEAREVTTVVTANATATVAAATGARADEAPAVAESTRQSEYRLLLYRIQADGTEIEKELSIDALDDLVGYFTEGREEPFMEGRYRIELEDSGTGDRREIRTFSIRDGRVVSDDADSNEGVSEQPEAETREPSSDESSAENSGADDATPDAALLESSQGDTHRSSRLGKKLQLAGVTVGAAAVVPWRERVRQAMESADRARAIGGRLFRRRSS